jgi:hypothetical protein
LSIPLDAVEAIGSAGGNQTTVGNYVGQLLAGNIASRHTVWRNDTDREVPE